jgi:hypothetical protein
MAGGSGETLPPKLLRVGVNVSHTCEATSGVPGRDSKGQRDRLGASTVDGSPFLNRRSANAILPDERTRDEHTCT